MKVKVQPEVEMEFKHELVMPNKDLPFRMFIFEGKDGNYRVAKHWHRSLELFLVMEGTIDFYINSQYYPLKDGDFVLVNSNEIHSIDSPLPNKTLVLQIPSEVFEEYMGNQFITFSKKKVGDSRTLIQMVTAMYREYEQKAYGYELRVRGWFYLLLHLLLTKFQDERMDQGTILKKRHLDQLSDITEYMRQHYREELTLEQVARQFGFSPTYLSRIFQRYAQVNYKTYLLDLRVEYGVAELMNTEHSLADIAEHQGFSDSRAFARAFEKRYGCLPSNYRKKIKSSENSERDKI